MSVDAVLQTALAPFGIPVYPNLYTGTDLEYIVTNYTEISALYAGDAGHAARYLISVRYHLPHKKNPNLTLRQLQRALYNAGCTWPGSVVNASDELGQIYVIECEYTDGGALYGDG